MTKQELHTPGAMTTSADGKGRDDSTVHYGEVTFGLLVEHALEIIDIHLDK